MDSGGEVTFTVVATVKGQKESYQTNEADDGAITIEGKNPTPQEVHDYVASLDIPSLWPNNTQYDYHTIIRKIISDESSVSQFYDGQPLWSQNNLHGAGLMQLTYPAPSITDVWDWQQNITDGAALINTDKLPTAINRLEGSNLYGRKGQVVGHVAGLFDKVQNEAAKLGANAAPITGDMIVLEAVRGFNGYNNGAGSFDEWEPVRDKSGKLVIKNGLTSWTQVPVSTRTAGLLPKQIKGVPTYVDDVLNSPDFQ